VRQTTVINRQPTIMDQIQRWWRQDRRIHELQPNWAGQPALAGATPAELLGVHLAAARRSDAGEAVLAGLVRLADRDELAAMCAVMMLLPAAKGVMGRMPTLDPRDDRDECSARVVALLFELVRTYPYWRRNGTVQGNITADLVKGIVRTRPKVAEVADAMTDYTSPDRGRADFSGPGSGDAWSHGGGGLNIIEPTDLSEPSAAEELIAVLVEAVQDGVLSKAEADLIAQRRIGGTSAGELAARRHIQPQSVRRSWQRAETNLVGALAAA
jgi:hypothetical protein